MKNVKNFIDFVPSSVCSKIRLLNSQLDCIKFCSIVDSDSPDYNTKMRLKVKELYCIVENLFNECINEL